MRKMILRALCFAAALSAGIVNAQQALRCDGALVSRGDHKVDVLDLCGEPDFREQLVEYPSRVVSVRGRPHVEYLAIPVVSEEWVYDRGPQRFRQLVRFRNNRVVAIENLRKPR